MRSRKVRKKEEERKGTDSHWVHGIAHKILAFHR